MILRAAPGRASCTLVRAYGIGDRMIDRYAGVPRFVVLLHKIVSLGSRTVLLYTSYALKTLKPKCMGAVKRQENSELRLTDGTSLVLPTAIYAKMVLRPGKHRRILFVTCHYSFKQWATVVFVYELLIPPLSFCLSMAPHRCDFEMMLISVNYLVCRLVIYVCLLCFMPCAYIISFKNYTW